MAPGASLHGACVSPLTVDCVLDVCGPRFLCGTALMIVAGKEKHARMVHHRPPYCIVSLYDAAGCLHSSS